MDGNPDTDFGNGHCSRTNASNPSWWKVDLGAKHVPVSEIYIVNSNEQQGNIDYQITFGGYIYIRTLVTQTLKGNEKQFRLGGGGVRVIRVN